MAHINLAFERTLDPTSPYVFPSFLVQIRNDKIAQPTDHIIRYKK